MRVKDLIKMLSRYDENMKVYINYEDDFIINRKVEWVSYYKDWTKLGSALFDDLLTAKQTAKEKNWRSPTFEYVLDIRVLDDELERWAYDDDDF